MNQTEIDQLARSLGMGPDACRHLWCYDNVEWHTHPARPRVRRPRRVAVGRGVHAGAGLELHL